MAAAVMGYKAAVHAGFEAAALQDLRTVAAVEAQYFHSHNRTFGTLDQLRDDHSLSRKFSGEPVVADGYVFRLSIARKSDGSSFYKLTADPQHETNMHHFYLDSTDERIHVSADRQAAPADPLQ